MKNLTSLKRLVVSFGLILLLTGSAGAAVQDTLRPASDKYTALNEWADEPSAGDRWDKIDEAVSDEDETYLFEDTDHAAYIYHTSEDWSGDGDPDSVEACYWLRKAEVFNTFTVAIGRATVSEGFFTWCGVPDTVTEGTQSYTLFKYMMTTDPCTDAAWTTASLNSASYGFAIRYARASTAAMGRYTQGYVVVYSTEEEEAEGWIQIIEHSDFHRPPLAYLEWRGQ